MRDIRAAGIQCRIVLMIVFGAIECLQRFHLGHDRAGEGMRLAEFRDIGLGGPLLDIAGGENLGAVLRALVRPLPVQLCRVMRHREIDLQQAAVGDLLWIEGDFDRFRVPRAAGADLLVAWSRWRAARISRNRVRHAHGMLEDGLNAPEAAAGKNRFLCFVLGGTPHAGERRINRGCSLAQSRTHMTIEGDDADGGQQEREASAGHERLAVLVTIWVGLHVFKQL